MEFISDNYFTMFPLISVLMIGVGIVLKIYLKKAGLNDLNRVLSAGAFGIKFLANALIVIGAFFLLTVFVAFYYYLKSEGYL